MENWQVALIVLASVLAGVLISVFLMLSFVLFRAAREVIQLGKQLEPTLLRAETISNRLETLSRGLKGGEKNIAELLSVVGELSRSLERNLSVINITTTVIAAAAPAVAAFIHAMRATDETDAHSNGS